MSRCLNRWWWASARTRPERDAIALATELASADGAVTLLHVQVVSARPAPNSGAVGAAAKYRHAIERLTTLADECAIAARVSCVEAPSPRRGLHQFASRQHADLLVVGASARDEVGRLLLGDDTREVLVDAPCAVAIAPAGYASRAASMRTIGVAYDRSAKSERALELARALAADHDAELTAFEAIPSPLYERDPANLAGESSELVEEARRRIAALGGVHADASVGDAVHELRRYAQSVDLLVIGSHRYRPIERVLEDTASQQLADEPSSPLLVLAAR